MSKQTPDTFCHKCKYSNGPIWCHSCIQILRRIETEKQVHAKTVPALRKAWEHLDNRFWSMKEEAATTTTTPDFKRYVDDCRQQAADALVALEKAEIEKGIRWGISGEVYPDA